MKIRLDPGAYAPTRAHGTDAGLDIRSMHGATIAPHDSYTIHTGVHIQLPPGTCGLLVSKSGLNTKYDITSTGLIDESYSGEILIRLHNHGRKYYDVRPGDKVSQLVILPCVYEPVELSDDLEHDPNGRGANGFGSTGR